MIKGFFRKLFVDKQKLERELQKGMRTALIAGGREFVREVARIVPVWTGETQGSLKPLADLVGAPLAINPDPTAPDNAVQRGASRATATMQLGPDLFTLTWISRVPHYEINERINANAFGLHLRRPGPYLSIPLATAKFTDAFLAATRDIDLGDKVIRLVAEIRV
jgi:hypothetical protein